MPKGIQHVIQLNIARTRLMQHFIYLRNKQIQFCWNRLTISIIFILQNIYETLEIKIKNIFYER